MPPPHWVSYETDPFSRDNQCDCKKESVSQCLLKEYVEPYGGFRVSPSKQALATFWMQSLHACFINLGHGRTANGVNDGDDGIERIHVQLSGCKGVNETCKNTGEEELSGANGNRKDVSAGQ